MKKLFIVLLIVLSATSIVFVSCRKDNLISTPNSSSMGDGLFKPHIPTIKIEDAKKWFDEQSHLGMNSFSGGDSSLFHTTPMWEQASNRFSQTGTEFITAPLNLTLTGGKTVPRLLIHRMPNGNFVGSYAIYMPDEAYHNRVQGQYHPLDFSGTVIYTELNGNFTNGYKIANGQAIGIANAKKNDGRGNNSVGLRTCELTGSYCMPVVAATTVYDCFDTWVCFPDGGGSGYYDPNLGGGSSSGSSSSGGTWGANTPNFGGNDSNWDTALDDAVFVHPPQNKIEITNLNDYLSCFTHTSGSSYKVTLSIDQPVTDTRRTYVDGNGVTGLGANKATVTTGHSFFTIEQTQPDGYSRIRNIGFYPKQGVTPRRPISQGILVNDENTPYDVGLEINLSETDFFNFLVKIKNAGTPNFDLNNFNCTGYCINRVSEIGITLPKSYGSWPLGGGLNPADLGQDVRYANNLSSFIVLNPTGGISSPNRGN